MLQRLLTLLVWTLVAASALAWAWRFQPVPVAAPGRAQAVGTLVDGADGEGLAPAARAQILARLLGAGRGTDADTGLPDQALASSARLTLQGVIADTSGAAGVALIAIDGKVARAYRVGASLEAGLVLQALGPRSASLRGTEGLFVLQMALPTASATAASSMATPMSPASLVAVMPAAGPAALGPSVFAATSPAAGQPLLSLRAAAPGEMLAPGRRQRLHAASEGSASEGP